MRPVNGRVNSGITQETNFKGAETCPGLFTLFATETSPYLERRVKP